MNESEKYHELVNYIMSKAKYVLNFDDNDFEMARSFKNGAVSTLNDVLRKIDELESN